MLLPSSILAYEESMLIPFEFDGSCVADDIGSDLEATRVLDSTTRRDCSLVVLACLLFTSFTDSWWVLHSEPLMMTTCKTRRVMILGREPGKSLIRTSFRVSSCLSFIPLCVRERHRSI